MQGMVYKPSFRAYIGRVKDRKLGDILTAGDGGEVVLLGFPHDAGVAINGGRVGARRGPEAFRHWIRRTGSVDNPEIAADLTALSITDAGDIDPALPLEKAHAELTRRVGSILKRGGIPFVVGGGNDQSYPNASALLDQAEEGPVGVINIDAHLDVRPLNAGRAHSGSPFRQLLEDDRFGGENFIEFAAQGSQCSRGHARFVEDNKGGIEWLSELREWGHLASRFDALLGNLAWQCPRVFVSFDLDSVSGADAPGVSCPASVGLSGQEAVGIAHSAGKHAAVRLFDLSEYNPDLEEERTGRLAASIFYYFCFGVAAREQKRV